MLSGRLAIHLVLLASAAVLPQILGDENLGRYSAVLGLVAILEVLSSGGLHVAELRFVPPLWRSDHRAAVRLASSIWTARMVFSLVAAGVGAVWLSLSPSLGGGLSSVTAIALWIFFRAALEATRHEFLAMGSVGPMVGFELVRAITTLLVVAVVFDQSGLPAVFASLAAAHALLWGCALVLLRQRAPLSPKAFDLDALRPMLRFGAATSIGMVAAMAQAHLPVYAVANWVSLEDAALLAVSVQLFVFAQALLIAPWTAVSPAFAELDANGEFRRMREWTGAMMRWSTAGAVMTALGWAFLGGTVVQIFPDSFAPVHEAGTLMLLAVVPLTAATSLNHLLYVGGHALAASINQVVFAATTVVGVFFVVKSTTWSAPAAMAVVYGLSALAFAICAYASVVRLRSMWLPVRRTAALIVPVALCWPAVDWEVGVGLRLGALVLVGVVYSAVALVTGLIPVDEVRQIRAKATRA